LAGASCSEKSSAKPPAQANPKDIIAAADSAGGSPAPAGDTGDTAGKPAAGGAAATGEIPGVDIKKLDARQQKLFNELADSLTSPCGKAHSLRTSATSDATCKRAPFAARYVAGLAAVGFSADEIRHFYDSKYKPGKTVTFDFAGVPFSGTPDAPVKLVEFFDFGCPACQRAKPLLDELLSRNEGKVVLYYKQYPLPKHTDSKTAAQAALAAHAQGKYKEMHDILFEKAPRHTKSDVTGYAKQLGLDMKKFEADFAAALPRIESEVKEGDAKGVEYTPTIFFNGRLIDSPDPRLYELWIEEEMAVNR